MARRTGQMLHWPPLLVLTPSLSLEIIDHEPSRLLHAEVLHFEYCLRFLGVKEDAIRDVVQGAVLD